jgi:hypothetical protein
MPSLANHQSNQFTKLLIEGDSKSGKTGSLCSLVKAGYKLRILDMDNGLDVLKQFVLRECPDKLGNVEFRTLRDERVMTSDGPHIKGNPKAFVQAVKMLDRWKYDDVDMGVPAEWGPDCILVIDSLTFLSDAAFDFREPLTPRSSGGKFDPRATYKDAQDAIENVLAAITGDSFHTNVIVISHVKYIENPDGTKKGYPVSVGLALSPTIPRYFNSVIRYVTKSGGKRVVETVSSEMFDLANPKPFEMEKTLNIETALADFFSILRPETKPVKLRKV